MCGLKWWMSPAAVQTRVRVAFGKDTPSASTSGAPLTDADGRPLPAATRTPVCDAVAERYGFATRIDGAWYRCCGGHVRKLVDCCGYTSRRINGDAALTGYCFSGRKVFCVMYFQTKVPC